MVESSRTTETDEEILERLRDPLYLPTKDEVDRSFSFLPSLLDFIDNPKITDFHRFIFSVFKNSIYEYPTQEYIKGLGSYITSRINELGASRENPITILEIAAGSDRIAHFLGEQLDKTTPGTSKVIATDNFSWPYSRTKIGIHVEDLGYDEALEKYKPAIVIGAWLPSSNYRRRYDPEGLEIARHIRQTPSVEEFAFYLL